MRIDWDYVRDFLLRRTQISSNSTVEEKEKYQLHGAYLHAHGVVDCKVDLIPQQVGYPITDEWSEFIGLLEKETLWTGAQSRVIKPLEELEAEITPKLLWDWMKRNQ
jgi:hypothetical protein